MNPDRALEHYPFDADTVTRMGQSENLVFKVTDTNSRHYSLRFHTSVSASPDGIANDPDAIRSELEWLHALDRDTDLSLPAPVRARSGEVLLDIDGVPCTLLTWVEGEQREAIIDERDARAIGALIGTLHKQASSWAPSGSFRRPVYDADRLFQSVDELVRLCDAVGLSPDTISTIRSAAEKSRISIQGRAQNPDVWGVIHADLIPGNLVFSDGRAKAIDFGGCGTGFFLFDLGWTFAYIHPALRPALLDAYSVDGVLPSDHPARLEDFFVAAQFETMSFWLGLPDHHLWLPQHLEKLSAREFGRYVNAEPFLFEGRPYWE